MGERVALVLVEVIVAAAAIARRPDQPAILLAVGAGDVDLDIGQLRLETGLQRLAGLVEEDVMPLVGDEDGARDLLARLRSEGAADIDVGVS